MRIVCVLLALSWTVGASSFSRAPLSVNKRAGLKHWNEPQLCKCAFYAHLLVNVHMMSSGLFILSLCSQKCLPTVASTLSFPPIFNAYVFARIASSVQCLTCKLLVFYALLLVLVAVCMITCVVCPSSFDKAMQGVALVKHLEQEVMDNRKMAYESHGMMKYYTCICEFVHLLLSFLGRT